MNKLVINLVGTAIIAVLLIVGCREDILVYPEIESDNFVYVSSDPAGASIFHKGVYLNLTTPAWLRNLESGKQVFTLKLQGYVDTSFSVSVSDSSKQYISVYMKVK